jgi:hypothetical protein
MRFKTDSIFFSALAGGLRGTGGERLLFDGGSNNDGVSR